MNPFRGINQTVTEMDFLYGRLRDVGKLRSRVEQRKDVLLLGVEGVGKTSLLLCALDPAYRKKMVREKRILITRPFDYPVRLENDRVFMFLVDQITEALDTLLEEHESERINEKIRKIIQQKNIQTEMFKAIVNMMYEKENYRIGLVIDNFERFTSSSEVTMAQHEIMRDLLERGYLRFVVASNYDINKDSLPPHIMGSYLIQKFFGSEMLIEGIGSKDALTKMLTQIGGDVMKPLAGRLGAMTGGVPAILIRAAAEAHDILEQQGGAELTEQQWQLVEDRTYESSRVLMKHWCGMLTEDMVQCLGEILQRDGVCAESGQPGLLVRRGLISEDINGGSRYQFVNDLLGRYIREGNVKSTDMTPPVPQAIPASTNEQVLREVVRQLLEGYSLSESRKRTEENEEPVRSMVKEVTVTAEEQQTIESIFDEYRRNYPTELPEDLMNDLGAFCMKEIQQALVFEALDGNNLGDTRRAALNAYGVVLERRLDDCLYDLFHMHERFSGVGTPNFGTMRRKDATIGSYTTVLVRCAYDMARCSLECEKPECDQEWWKGLKDDLMKAKDLRNNADHDEPVEGKVVADMHDLLLGSGQLLRRLSVGKALFEKACGGIREATYEDQSRISGQIVEFECREVTINNSLKGVLKPYGFAVSISAKKTEKNLVKLNLPKGLNDLKEGVWRFEVIIDGYDSQTKQFLATPCSPARR